MIIGISGKKNAGKDVVADYISEKMFLNKHILFDKVKFADKLKEIVCLLINCTLGDLEDREFKETELNEKWWKWEIERDGGYGTISLPYLTTPKKTLKQYENLKLVKFTPRLLLQLLGTDYGRKNMHPDIWVNSTMSNFTKDSNWVISDVRFPNEAEAIKDKGGILIRIDRPEFSDTGEHLSEVALDEYRKFDYTILNNGTIEDLYAKIDKVLMSIEGIH